MSSLLRFLSFVPPILFFVCPAFTQIQGTITQLPGSNTYQVSVLPNQDIALPFSLTSSAQITLRASTGKLSLNNFQSLTGDWEFQSQYNSPTEAPGQDYFRFFLINPLTTITYSAGTEVPLFTFENSASCTMIELVDNDSDPFVSNNTLMVDARSYFTLGLLGPGVNAYEGNGSNSSVACPTLAMEVTADNNPVDCNGDVTNLTVKAMKGKEPYTVVYTHLPSGTTSNASISTFEGSTTFSDLPAGAYKFNITDFQDSTSQTDYSIMEPPPIDLVLSPGAATCTQSNDGNIAISYVNGIDGEDFDAYQYFWDQDPTNSNQVLDSLLTGSYTVTVMDANGCTTTASEFVDVYNLLVVNETIKQISCFGENDGAIAILAASSTLSEPFSFNWSPNATTGSTEATAWMLGPGDYHVTITDASGTCPHVETYTLEEPDELKLEYELVEPICYGDEAYLNILSVTGDQGGYAVELTGTHTQLSDFTYEVEPGVPMQIIISDANECEITDDFLIPNKQEMTVDLGDDITIKYGENITIEGEVFPLSGVQLEWTPNEGLDCTDCPNPSATPTEDTNYALSLIDDDGCVVSDDINVTVYKSRDIYIPNAFSPNRDGINDYFRPFGGFEIIEVKSLMVFNRWGGLIYDNSKGFTLEELDAGWNGMVNDKEIDPGTYLYTMDVQFIDGEIVLFSGEVNLIK
ncbi:MAG: gliding motility-associated C-terminal domain-containing protein [Bacteroidota bacterium]